MAAGSELAREYLNHKNIPQLFESLVAGLAHHRPEDPISFLQSCLEEAKQREGRYSWNLFVSRETASRSVVFSRSKPLPPISERQPAAVDRPIFFVLGGPGCGKGTQCERLVRQFGLVHLSSGDLLREEASRGSPRGHVIQQLMQEGKLVPPELTVELLKSAIAGATGANGFLIDGFPRELTQAHLFEEEVGECEAVVVFECGEEQLLERLRKRGETSGRADDNETTIRKRLATFTESTLPVVQHYQTKSKVAMVDAAGSVDEVFSQVRKLFQNFLSRN